MPAALTAPQRRRLVAAARRAAAAAYAPYSRFPVGAAVLAETARIASAALAREAGVTA